MLLVCMGGVKVKQNVVYIVCIHVIFFVYYLFSHKKHLFFNETSLVL